MRLLVDHGAQDSGGGLSVPLAMLLALPGAGLAGAAGYLDIASVAGMALAGGAVVYLVLGGLVVLPWLRRGAAGPGDPASVFLERALATDTVGGLAGEFERALRAATGAQVALLIAPSPEGGVAAVSSAGVVEVGLDDVDEAFVWLSERVGPLAKRELLQLEGEGPAAAGVLLDRLGGDTLLPLRHRGVLLGLGVVGSTSRRGDHMPFLRAMRAFTTAAMANMYLRHETSGKQALTHHFDLATAMQEALMPDTRAVRRPTFELRGVFRPVEECGGDLWAWREIGEGKVLLVIADATGHGAAPALLAAVAKGSIEAYWQRAGADLDPARLLRALNRTIFRAGRTRYMMTAFAAVLDKDGGRLTFANAGQNFPYFVNSPTGANPGKIEALVARGNTLGAAEEATYETHTRPMAMGDKLVLYTDGVVEAGSPGIEPFGERRFRAALSALANERATRMPDIIMEEVERFLSGHALSDDVTLAVAEFGPVEQAV